ncbi:MAG: NAD-dependent epimerase/dehydratase family protein [Kiritimatiellae bacterium]|nr:NAD-dependent epimerase/dehydratase family protein [Kiritimatiellia bacterium]
MYLDNKSLLLAGSTGLVGTSVLREILASCPTTRIRACAHSRTKPFIHDDRVAYVTGDLREGAFCREAVRGCDAVIMAAADTSGAAVLKTEPWRQVNANLMMNANLLEAAAQQQVRRALWIGSATLYQEFEGAIKEDELDLNRDPHPAYLGVGWVTRYVEKLCRFWHETRGTEIVIVRASNIFGPYARFDPATSNFIPAIIRKAVDRMDPFEVWGSADVTRDVLYADDFAAAVVALVNHEATTFDVFNVGSGVRTTVGDVVQWALKCASHCPSAIHYLSDKPTTIRFRALDCGKIENRVGWTPQHSVEEGLKKTTAWWTENKGCWKR